MKLSKHYQVEWKVYFLFFNQQRVDEKYLEHYLLDTYVYKVIQKVLLVLNNPALPATLLGAWMDWQNG